MSAATDYTVNMVPIGSITPSPENDVIYGAITDDAQMEILVDSIQRRGLEEPITVTADGYILSGHRRYHACQILGYEEIPIRQKLSVRREGNDEYLKLLTEYNPQRVKTVGTIVKESLLRFADADPGELLYRHEQAAVDVEAEFVDVIGSKHVAPVDGRRIPFLKAALYAIKELKDFWPLSVRQIHYRLLNNPPLTQTCANSRQPKDRWRYKNTKQCYGLLVKLLTAARYNGQADMMAIDDATRPQFPFNTSFQNVQQFVDQNMKGFLVGYHRSPQFDQPRHVEVFGEKNTLVQIMKPVCEDYYVPLSIGRGYGSIPVWRDMAQRFRKSGKNAMSLIILSDYDPEGLDLAMDAVRSLRDMFGVSVDYHRVGVTLEQVKDFELETDFNPAKETSARLASFVKESGSTETWEVEALPPDYLQDELRAAIESNLDMEIYQASTERVVNDAIEIKRMRAELVKEMGL
ncbi:MAG: ParB/RepB/Spo0J family partition protein [Fuerstiella sp.]|nr:ParB/RepB/Spo0J family partition protein [Fuerstiella sp.]